MKKLRSKLTYANVIATLALFLVLAGGTAYATEALPKESVGTEQLKGYAVTGAKIANGSLNSLKLAPNAVTEPAIAKGAVTTNKLPTGSVVNSKIATGAVNSASVADGSLTKDDLGNNSITGSKVIDNTLTGADFAGADTEGPISLTAGLVPVGRCLDLPASVPGAHAGESVLVSAVGTLQDGILLYGVGVPSDGTVTLAVCNFSGTTQEAISNFTVHVMTFE